jgi:hypothetical protein
VYTVPESDEEEGTGMSRAEPAEVQHADEENDHGKPSASPQSPMDTPIGMESEDSAIPAINFGAGILNTSDSGMSPDDKQEEQAEADTQVSQQEQDFQQKTLLQSQHAQKGELEQELEEDDIDMVEDADDQQCTMLSENAVKAMPQAAKLHADSMEKMVTGGQDAGQAICSIVQDMYSAILSSLTKYAEEVSQKAIAIGDERANQSNQQSQIDQAYEQTSHMAGLMQVRRDITQQFYAHVQACKFLTNCCTLRCWAQAVTGRP